VVELPGLRVGRGRKRKVEEPEVLVLGIGGGSHIDMVRGMVDKEGWIIHAF
jgi:glycerol dehydrogenase-like iron-containing ADH family enzyme